MNSRTSPWMAFLREEWLQVLLLILPLLAATWAALFSGTGGSVPIHWNAGGMADGFVPAPWGLFILPLLALLTTALVYFFEHRDKYRQTQDGSLSSHGKAVQSIRIAISMFFAMICFIQIAWLLGLRPESAKLIPSAVGLLLAFIGNFFGKLQPNRYAGIRVPWTLNSPVVWRKTHRMAGWLWSGGGLLFAVLVFFLPVRLLSTLTLAWLGLLIMAPLVYAWYCARLEGPSKGPDGA